MSSKPFRGRSMLVTSANGDTGRKVTVTLSLDLFERLERHAFGSTMTATVADILERALPKLPRRAAPSTPGAISARPTPGETPR